ncbi:Sedlin [Aspergillus eucalypticola CBS 122712]|uniref:Sedlin n=1 Tax=Aspergillus eucalypticola (strain CBS 122712 / IBT 29274) TaxID=1448314 RepID=A0A317UU28_ASPEC|nr:Sedlin [Aspergillus eucalypticola CBS 122712]PWY63540.1 Sedlin [Aspergillus eucalypticola CBS 122712]
MALPKIACIGVIGKADNPLHVSLFPPYVESTIEFSFILNSCLDIFEIRRKQTSIDQDLGLLQAVDERLAAYGWLSTTGVKFLVIVDLIGQPISDEDPKGSTKSGLREFDLKAVFRTLQTAYVQLLQNPFHRPDEHMATAKAVSSCSSQITDQRFINEVNRIGNSWVPIVASL